ncbi:HAMP domain-containing sensor histidine kinase [Dactylosporangium sp. NPDC005572]|uniref:sensor histidine kinase n=1 Tax=Dactylosporangium sp. NPDC005572 TaxID=3156889 RepID=UPI0033BDEED8
MAGDRLRGSMRWRTTAAVVAVVGAVMVAGAVVMVAAFGALLERELHASVAVRAADAARLVDGGGDPAAGLAADDDIVLQVLGPSGEVLSSTPNARGLPALTRLEPGRARTVTVPFDDDPVLFVTADARDGRRVLLGHSLDGVKASTRSLAALLAIGLPLLTIVVGAAAWRAVGRALAPVEAIRTEVDEITRSRLDRRVTRPRSHDEVGRLADTMNRMLERLERARDRERRFIADAAHELRSPIAAIRQQSEVTLRHPTAIPAATLAATAHVESLRMQALVEDLLLLAQADEGSLGLRRRTFDLAGLVTAEADRLRDATGRLTVDTAGASSAWVDGDPATLRRLLRNLGDNAARHARRRVTFTLATESEWAVLRVDDDGPGVPADDRVRIFDRFVRLDDARDRETGGSGLGLAIVADIVTAHHGSVVIEDSPAGGARATVRLPTSASR